MVVAVPRGVVPAYFAVGLGSRTVMKLIALSDPSTEGKLVVENEATVESAEVSLP